MYLAVNILDTGVWANNPAIPLNDGIELYIDTLGDKATIPMADDLQLRIDVFGRVEFLEGSGTDAGQWSPLSKTGIESACFVNGTINDDNDDIGYTIEVKILWSVFGSKPANDIGITFGMPINDGVTNGWLGITDGGSFREPQDPSRYMLFNSTGIHP